MSRLRLPRAEVVALVLGALAVLVAAGAPATAKSLLTGKAFKAGTVGSSDLAAGAVTPDKVAAETRALVRRGATGAPGAPGAKGAPGATGAAGDKGPPNALDVVDARGRRLGRFVDPSAVGSFVTVRTDAGALLAYDPGTTSNYATPLGGSQVYFSSNDCSGQAYAPYVGLPLQFAVSTESPTYGGSPLWQYNGGSGFESISYASVLTASGCAATTGSLATALRVDPAGEAPPVKKPLRIVPAR